MKIGRKINGSTKGFSLAEILIALALMAVLAAFAIPKIFNQNNKEYRHKVVVQEVAHIIEAAYAKYRANNNPTSATGWDDLTPYLNYVKLDTTVATIDEDAGAAGSIACNFGANMMCIVFPNGAKGFIYRNASVGTGATFGASPTFKNALLIHLDPDGIAGSTGTTDGISKSVTLHLYYDGKIRSHGNMLTGTCSNAGCPNPIPDNNPTADPFWFNWN